MKAVIQRVSSASVTASGAVFSEIGKGYLILLGVCNTDTQKQATLLARKVCDLRIFTDDNDKMNLSLTQIDGQALVVSNFTLCANTKKGNRPSFINAMESSEADRLYRLFCDCLLENGVSKVAHGVFGADMQVSLVNDGPVTITLDTDIWEKK